ncbi:unnamed protein product [Danaus chrysippus]|uniref:(African queen) hypothetical protein n=1 Tax=Danaus chrysippus TaxID=151541 RepID=A0A8J2QSD7_9NEOP|nr:unnamed protein product [Danaus chrysippus]
MSQASQVPPPARGLTSLYSQVQTDCISASVQSGPYCVSPRVQSAVEVIIDTYACDVAAVVPMLVYCCMRAGSGKSGGGRRLAETGSERRAVTRRWRGTRTGDDI